MRRRDGVDRARYEQVIEQRDVARTEAAQHVCKIVELCAEVDGLREQLAAVRRRMASLRRTADTEALVRRLDVSRKAASRVLAAYHAEKHRADRLQARLDDALGLNDPHVKDGRYWQQTRADKKGGMP